MYLLDVSNTILHTGCTDVDCSLDRCRCHSFGLLKCGCNCVRSLRGEEPSKYVRGSWRHLFFETWLIIMKRWRREVKTPDGIHRLWNYFKPTNPWGYYVPKYVSKTLPACVTLHNFTLTSGIHFWAFFFPQQEALLLGHTLPSYYKTRLIQLDVFSIQAPTHWIVNLECAEYREVHLFFLFF